MRRYSSKCVSMVRPIGSFAATILVGASLFSGIAASAQAIIYNNTNTTNAVASYNNNGTGEDYNSLFAFTVPGTGGNAEHAAWVVSSLEIGLYNYAAATARDQILLTFYSNIDAAATGTTVVNNNELFEGQIYNGNSPLNRLVPGENIITATAQELFLLPNAATATTFAVQVSILDSAGTAFDTNIHPILTYAPTAGSNPGSNIWENTNNNPTNVPDTYTGSNGLSTQVGANNYNVFFQLNATIVPGPSALSVLAMGGVPMLGLLRLRRRKAV